MILGFLINLFSLVLVWLIGFLPTTGGLGSYVNTGIQQFGSWVHLMDYYFPAGFAISLVISSLGIEIGLWFAYFIFWLIKTIADVIP